jgi:hypothetical protein
MRLIDRHPILGGRISVVIIGYLYNPPNSPASYQSVQPISLGHLVNNHDSLPSGCWQVPARLLHI